MGIRARIFKRGEKNIFYIDFSDISLAQEFELALAEAEAIWSSTQNIGYLQLNILANFSDTQLNPDILELVIRYCRLVRAVGHKHFIVGLRPTSIVRDILKSYTGKKIKYFKSNEEAAKWMVSSVV